jgi:hypothetical protein
MAAMPASGKTAPAQGWPKAPMISGFMAASPQLWYSRAPGIKERVRAQGMGIRNFHEMASMYVRKWTLYFPQIT